MCASGATFSLTLLVEVEDDQHKYGGCVIIGKALRLCWLCSLECIGVRGMVSLPPPRGHDWQDFTCYHCTVQVLMQYLQIHYVPRT